MLKLDLGSPTAAKKITSANENLTVFPNPIQSEATVSIESQNVSEAKMEVLNLSGKLMQTVDLGQLQAGENEVNWHPDGMSAGTYLLRITTSDRVLTKKVIVK